jgi:hypothetical protein
VEALFAQARPATGRVTLTTVLARQIAHRCGRTVKYVAVKDVAKGRGAHGQVAP